jgi:hypothetical protein
MNGITSPYYQMAAIWRRCISTQTARWGFLANIGESANAFSSATELDVREYPVSTSRWEEAAQRRRRGIKSSYYPA